MSYEKNTWASGDVITAEKLNHMEDGVDIGAATAVLQWTGTVTSEAQVMEVADEELMGMSRGYWDGSGIDAHAFYDACYWRLGAVVYGRMYKFRQSQESEVTLNNGSAPVVLAFVADPETGDASYTIQCETEVDVAVYSMF